MQQRHRQAVGRGPSLPYPPYEEIAIDSLPPQPTTPERPRPWDAKTLEEKREAIYSGSLLRAVRQAAAKHGSLLRPASRKQAARLLVQLARLSAERKAQEARHGA